MNSTELVTAVRRSGQLSANDTTYTAVAILEECHNTRRLACITYGGSDGIYYRGFVPHMVCLVCFDRKANRAAILDNNNPGKILWMTCGESIP